ncbi:hypothetical protein Adeg_0632 [Ammonifex degensii KC4]|uniref:DUF5652 domain-containing protein n=1 Tax=Ammonifex degensii (strain DSM 10501 / KC4) TaxID=429009 RepID=C9RC03_AMMDK|nr:DUF5652 family protein [Ammonifex degensii]ACX51780.1 hypothetical protein Adeg_0632 [Ammonifex degensii KC4]
METITIQIPYFKPWVLVLILAWSLFWKGWALWRSARNDQRGWFIILLLVNTVGVLDIIYLLTWGRRRPVWGRRWW